MSPICISLQVPDILFPLFYVLIQHFFSTCVCYLNRQNEVSVFLQSSHLLTFYVLPHFIWKNSYFLFRYVLYDILLLLVLILRPITTVFRIHSPYQRNHLIIIKNKDLSSLKGIIKSNSAKKSCFRSI